MSVVLGGYLETMRKLGQSDPAVQAETFQAARDAAQLTPTTANRLRFALALATPGHGGSDPAAARNSSRSCGLAELLLPPEQALAQVELRQVELRIVLTEVNGGCSRSPHANDRERTAAAARRLQAEVDENKRLRKTLEEAQAKLDAVDPHRALAIERNPNGNQQ